MNPMIPNLHGSKMSSSHPPETKIMFLDDAETVKNKFLSAPWHDLDTATNSVLSLLKHVLIPIAQLQLEQHDTVDAIQINGAGHVNGDTVPQTSAAKGAVFAIEVDGICRTFSSYSDVEQSLTDGSIQPDDIKTAVAKGVDDLLEHVRKMYKDNSEWQAVDNLAYPETK